MILISHRGNLEGPSDLENHPAQIKKVLDLGYDCEIDVWYEFGEFYLVMIQIGSLKTMTALGFVVTG